MSAERDAALDAVHEAAAHAVSVVSEELGRPFCEADLLIELAIYHYMSEHSNPTRGWVMYRLALIWNTIARRLHAFHGFTNQEGAEA